ncbi:MAG: PBP1A family penicillin-binding protein [Acidobacteria bacterium]|nr:MAG: PBP1A family penicillin-binding protein [Acidobacteriota bacterium]
MIPLKSRWRLILSGIALACLAVVVISLVFGYVRFKPILDARLQKQPHTNAVYSRPFELSVGERLSLKDLRQELAESGYEQKARGDGSQWYEVGRNGVRVYHSRNGKPEVLTIKLDNGVVRGIQNGNLMVQKAALKPRFLSNLFGNSREKRKYVRYADIPDQLMKAVLAAEDAQFFQHHGLDLPSLARAAFVNIKQMKPRSAWQGGSTITQQFIKNYFLTPKKSLRRKLEEAYLAVLVESRFSKQQIFEFYANEVYMGQAGSFGMVGLGQAADGYLGKPLRALTLAENALLAGMIQAPNRYSPFADREAAMRRRNFVLSRMVAEKLITPKEAEVASREPIKTVSSTRHLYTEAPYFIDYLGEAASREVPDWRKSEYFEVFSTLDPELQQAALEAVRTTTPKIDRQLRVRKDKVRPEVALVAVDPRSGDVLAMIGGRNYGQTQFNRALHALRQPGSSFKPFVFATALQSGQYTLGSIVLDAPYEVDFGDEHYEPTNFGGGYRGNVTLRRALALSLNVPTVKIAEHVGYQTVAQFSHKLGFSEQLQGYPSLALGTWEVSLLDMVQAYTAFANQGQVVRLRGMTAYTKNGEQHDVPVVSRQAITPEVAYLITSTLESAVNWGTGAGVRAQGFRLPVAGKTGSSNDSWFAGYTPDLLCVVWVGYDDFSDIGLIGADAALPVWVDFMKRAEKLRKVSGAKFPVPSNIVTRYIDTSTGLLATFNCPNTQPEQFIAGTEPARSCYADHYEEFQEEMEQETVEDGQAEQGKEKKGFWDFLKVLKP